MFGLCS